MDVTLARVDEVCADLAPACEDWLSAPELVRWRGISASSRQRQFVAGRWLARQCLAQRFGGDWRQYVLSAPEEGAPGVLACPAHCRPEALYFSLSHSANWLLCGVASHPLGVDIEDTGARQRDTDAMGQLVYGPREQRQIKFLTATQRRDFFYASWTLKEAWIKRAFWSDAMPAMPSIEVRPGDEAGIGHALVMRCIAFVAAVTPAPPHPFAWRVQGRAGLPDDLSVSAWQYEQPLVFERADPDHGGH